MSEQEFHVTITTSDRGSGPSISARDIRLWLLEQAPGLASLGQVDIIDVAVEELSSAPSVGQGDTDG